MYRRKTVAGWRTAAALCVAAAAANVAPAWTTDLVGEALAAPADLAAGAEERLRDRLEVADADVQARISVKEALIEGVVQGRVGLAEAAAAFRDLNAVRPTYMAVLRSSHPGLPDEQVIARNVIEYAAPRAAGPDQQTALAARLEREYALMFPGDRR